MLARLTASLFRGKRVVLEIDDHGNWQCPAYPVLARSLDSTCSPGDFGPAYGDPIACAAHAAQDLLGGMVEIKPTKSMPPGTVY